jgi:hypothetical protein
MRGSSFALMDKPDVDDRRLRRFPSSKSHLQPSSIGKWPVTETSADYLRPLYARAAAPPFCRE